MGQAAGGPIVAVTGGNRGIGFEICRQLAGRGAHVVLTARKTAAGKAAIEKLAKEKLAAEFHALDVTDGKSIAALRDFLNDRYSRLDVLINNAGVIAKGENSALKVDLATVRTTVETNTLGPLRLAQELAPLLKRSKSGRIINMSSGMGELSDNSGGHAAYRLSKTALNGVTATLAAELHGPGPVNSRLPGWGRAGMGRPAANVEVADGPDSRVWLAPDRPQKLTGKF